MKFINSRGQGGEVFKLLISAIVAFAILAILLGLLPDITLGSKPGETSKNLINEAIKNPGSPRASNQNVRFGANENIVASAISSGTGITPDQLCVSKGEHENTAGFEFRGTGAFRGLYYSGQSLNTSLEVLCNSAASIQENFSGIYEGEFNTELSEGTSATDPVFCGQSCLGGAGNTCCVVILKYAKSGN